MAGNKEHKLKMNKLIYNRDNIEKTKNAFEDICDCEIKENENYFLINLVSKIPDGGNLKFEFANYLLALRR